MDYSVLIYHNTSNQTCCTDKQTIPSTSYNYYNKL